MNTVGAAKVEDIRFKWPLKASSLFSSYASLFGRYRVVVAAATAIVFIVFIVVAVR